MATRADEGRNEGFVGRIRELGEVRSAIEHARAGQMQAVLVSGDAGVGKTRLVERACTDAVADDPEAVLLTGSCLPLSTMTVPLVPLKAALKAAPATLRAPSLTATGPAGSPRPDTAGATGGTGAVDALAAVDAWLERVCRDHLVVLVVDDLQWADETTLDVLMYVVAGSSDRRLAVVCTLRLGEAGTGHALQRWLADVRRMPCFAGLHVGPLDRAETREQIRALLKVPPHETLVGEVYARTGGNAYLTRLLVEDLPPDSRHLGANLPPDLGAAVLRPWHRLSDQARELVRTIAVGGEVAVGPSLTTAARLAGVAPSLAPRLLRDAVEAGVLDVDAAGGYWFHHPLQAEALEASLAGEELRQVHAAFAAQGELDLLGGTNGRTDDGPGDGIRDDDARLAAITAIADHHHRAQHPAEAYRWALRAADAGAGSERMRLLRRALALRGQLPTAAESRLDLLLRLRDTAAGLGDHEEELGAVEAVLALLDPEAAGTGSAADGSAVREPPAREHALLVAELLVRREHLRFSTGRGFLRVEPAQRAVALSADEPLSRQHAYALAELAHASLWQEAPDAHDVARDSLVTAVAVDDPAALAYAYAAAAMSAVFRGRHDAAELAGLGVAAATRARDWWGYVHASLWEANGTACLAEPEFAHLLQARRESLETAGGPHPYIAWMSAAEAGSWLFSGRWEECTDRLRVALGSDPGAAADVMARLVATRLAVLQGRQKEAEAHLARAEELFAETTAFLAFEFDAVRASVRLAGGDPSGAVDAALTGATTPGVPPTMCEWLMPLAARGLSDLAEEARERGEPLGGPLGRLDELVGRFPRVISDFAFDSPFYRRQLAALDALYAAEVARGRRSPDETERWAGAADLLGTALPWEAAYAAFRAAESGLVRGLGSRDQAAAMLRRSHAMASRLRAEPVDREVADLARVARIPLENVTSSASSRGPSGSGEERPWGITPREREILDHIVAGRTYGEIARSLFLSEKTVSSHVSNLLRKTRTANRVELARLAQHRDGHPL